MTGTGRRRKPSSGEEEPRPDEASGTTWSTHSAPPEPEYSYDWRQGDPGQDGHTQQGQGQGGSSQFPAAPQQSFAPSYAPSAPVPPPYIPTQPEPARVQYPQPQQPYQPPTPEQSYFAAQTYVQPPPYQPADDMAGLFDDEALFDPEPAASPEPIATPTRTQSPIQSQPQAGDEEGAERGPTKISSSAADYAFVEEETDEKDVKNWLTFVESRADTRADRARRLRTRLIAAGVAVVVVLGGTLTYLWATGSPLLSTAAPATRNSILLQILDTDNDAVANAILVADKSSSSGTTGGATASPAGRGAAVLIPSQMVVNSISSGSQPFGGKMLANPMVAPAGADTVAASLGVQVDGVWDVDETTFAALIDAFGGVQVTTNAAVPAVTAVPTPASTATSPAGVPTGIPTTAPTTGGSAPNATSTSPAVPLGAGKLTGAQALAYALYQAPNEPIGAQVDRFGQVLGALLTEMPTTAELVTAYLNQLGVVYDPTLPESKVAAVLAQMAAEQQASAMTVKALPLQDNSSNQLDFAAAGPIITSLLGGTVQSGLPSGGAARVLVEDGTGQTDGEAVLIESAAQAELVNGGYSYIGSITVSKRSKTEIEIPTGADQSAAAEVASTLQLPASDIHVVAGMSEISDITVILGTDWIQTGMNGG